MADTDPRDPFPPAGAADIETPPADATFRPAAPLKDAGVAFESDAAAEPPVDRVAAARQQLADGTAKVRAEASDKARVYAEDGKARAIDALGQLTSLLNDAAGQVDDKIGTQYGQYARTVADRVQTFSSSLDAKSVDELFEQARELVRRSPAVAVGAAAAVGFVVARLLTSGFDQRDA